MANTAPPLPPEPVQDPTAADKPAAEQPITGFREKRPRSTAVQNRVVPLYGFEVVVGVDRDDYVFDVVAHDEQDALRQVIDGQQAFQARITTLRKLVTRKSWRPVNLADLSESQITKIQASVSKLPESVLPPAEREKALAELEVAEKPSAPQKAKDDKQASSPPSDPAAQAKTDDQKAKDDKQAK